MSFDRDITVTIGGTAFTTDTLANIQIEMGGRTWWEQSVAGVARLTINQQDPGIIIADTFTIDVDDQTGTPVRLFTGVVDATSAAITDIGPLWDITASGPLTQAGRRQLTSIIAADTEGDQIALLAQDALATSWEEAVGTWAAASGSWDSYALDTSAIDTPGLYDLAAIDQLPATVVDEMAKAAFSGAGWLYETRDGLLGYADSTHRESTAAADYITIPGSVTARNAFVTATREADIANVLEVVYDGGTVEGKALDSIQVYGRWDRSYDTTLALQSDAEAFVTRRLELEGAPRLNLAGSIRIPLDQTSDNLLDQLLEVERNYGIILQNVPTYLAADQVYRGFVEGYVWSLGPVESTLDLFLSEYSLSNFGLRWAAAGPTLWNGVGASLTWQDATEALA